MDDAELTSALAATVARARAERGLSTAELADRSGVSRAMISKVERAEAQPTAALLSKLSAALGLTLSDLIARAEDAGTRLLRRADQPTWTDPDTGYTRRAVSPPSGRPLELVEVELPPHTTVSVPAETYAFIHQQLLVLTGTLHFHEGATVHTLHPGDCLQLSPDPQPCAFVNPTAEPTTYLVALTRRFH